MKPMSDEQLGAVNLIKIFLFFAGASFLCFAFGVNIGLGVACLVAYHKEITVV